MTRVTIYEIALIAPALIFSIRVILIELSKGISVTDYTEQQIKVKNLIAVLTRTKLDQNILNEELVSILQMSAIMISAGESPVTSLKHIAERSEGIIPEMMRREFDNLESGGNLVKTLDYLAVTSSSKQVKRLGNSIQVAIDRGSPILQVIQNQVNSINKEIHIQLLRKSGKSEIALLIPVVFLILPVSILFAIWPSLYSLNFGAI
jgi:tight adherence protein C